MATCHGTPELHVVCRWQQQGTAAVRCVGSSPAALPALAPSPFAGGGSPAGQQQQEEQQQARFAFVTGSPSSPPGRPGASPPLSGQRPSPLGLTGGGVGGAAPGPSPTLTSGGPSPPLPLPGRRRRPQGWPPLAASPASAATATAASPGSGAFQLLAARRQGAFPGGGAGFAAIGDGGDPLEDEEDEQFFSAAASRATSAAISAYASAQSLRWVL